MGHQHFADRILGRAQGARNDRLHEGLVGAEHHRQDFDPRCLSRRPDLSSLAVSAAVWLESARSLDRGSSGGRGRVWKWRLRTLTALARRARQMLTAITMQAVAGLNERYGWAPRLPSWLVALGVALFVLGFPVLVWAMTVNRPSPAWCVSRPSGATPWSRTGRTAFYGTRGTPV